MDLNKVPKQFCDNVTVGCSKEAFILIMQTGGTGTAYAFTPEHAKRLSQSLAHNIAEYEKSHGKIDAEWNPNIKSPIQSTDLPNDSGSTGSQGKDRGEK